MMSGLLAEVIHTVRQIGHKVVQEIFQPAEEIYKLREHQIMLQIQIISVNLTIIACRLRLQLQVQALLPTQPADVTDRLLLMVRDRFQDIPMNGLMLLIIQ